MEYHQCCVYPLLPAPSTTLSLGPPPLLPTPYPPCPPTNPPTGIHCRQGAAQCHYNQVPSLFSPVSTNTHARSRLSPSPRWSWKLTPNQAVYFPHQ
ncbi:hypothetical protein Hamer_G019143 [Homarus americanus]|uniref:Uncharacterized protein n=1 Tax=Homarus americanus TaxID=6706 RepID=A0A8J5JX21_HOMAM|nr:hypothetical protein Hamer_G019143 [Homarus americanus]